MLNFTFIQQNYNSEYVLGATAEMMCSSYLLLKLELCSYSLFNAAKLQSISNKETFLMKWFPYGSKCDSGKYLTWINHTQQ